MEGICEFMTGTARTLRVATAYYFRNYYRSKSFYLMLIIAILVSVLLTYFSLKYINRLDLIIPKGLLSTLGNSGKEEIFGYLWAFVLLDLPVFASVFFGSTAISSEIENKTAFHIFLLPIGRVTLLVSKYLAAVAVTFITVLIYVAFQAAVFEYLFPGPLLLPFYQSLGLLLIFVFSITAFTFLISSIFNKNTYAYITVFLIYFLVFNAYEIIVEFLYKTTPYYLLNVAADAMEKVYLNISTNPFSTSSSTFAPATVGTLYTSIGVMVAYAIVSFAAALIIFDRKEVK